jgi:hypothetical protein
LLSSLIAMWVGLEAIKMQDIVRDTTSIHRESAG